MCSHGGHLTELMALRTAWADYDHFWITYDSARTRSLTPAYRVRNIGFNPLLMFIGSIRIGWILIRERPDVIISNGAELAIPAVVWGRLLGARVLFIEVWTRVRLPTLTGRLVYRLCDSFFVMWPELKDAYGPRAKYVGGLV